MKNFKRKNTPITHSCQWAGNRKSDRCTHTHTFSVSSVKFAKVAYDFANKNNNTNIKAPRTGAAHTLTWITRLHFHTCINTVITTWCEAPAQLLHNLESNFFFEDTWGRGSKQKTPDSLAAIGITYERRKSNVPDGNWILTLQHWWYARLAKSAPHLTQCATEWRIIIIIIITRWSSHI